MRTADLSLIKIERHGLYDVLFDLAELFSGLKNIVRVGHVTGGLYHQVGHATSPFLFFCFLFFSSPSSSSSFHFIWSHARKVSSLSVYVYVCLCEVTDSVALIR
jgi:hypothetical protein